MTLITTTADLAAACKRLSAHAYVTIDTEFVRETTFWPVLCLVQLASDEEALIVDPMAEGIDLTPLQELLADETTLKVFHAARQDIEIFFKLFGVVPVPVFDTQVAAMVCGFGDSIAYDQLVKRISGAHIDKSLRFTNWALRPLADKHLDYALADVTHLRDVYQHLKTMLEEGGRAHWVQEEMAVLTSPATYDLAPEDAWQRLKLRIRKPIEFAILKKLAEWREGEARSRNVPRSRVLKDDVIYEAAQSQPADIAAVARLRTLSRGMEKTPAGAAIVAAVTACQALDRSDLPSVPRPPNSPEGTGAAVDLLKVLLKFTADENNVAQKILASADHLEQIAIHGDQADVPAMHGWRRELLGDRALDLLAGKLALSFQNKKVNLIDNG